MNSEDFKFSFCQTLFKPEITYSAIDIRCFDNMVRDENLKSLILKYRQTKDKQLKSKLPVVLFSGVFKKRCKKGFIRHSKFICLDIDDISNAEELKEKFKELDFVHYMFFSPSMGLKIVIKIETTNEEEHIKYFLALEGFFKEKYDIQIDKACKDISRACYLSYDENPYWNKKSITLKNDFIKNNLSIEQNKKIEKSEVKIESGDYYHIVEKAVKRFLQSRNGEKHTVLRNQSVHLGYYINAKLLTYSKCYNSLYLALNKRKEDIDDLNAGLVTIEKGLLFGMENPKPVNGIKINKKDYQFWYAYKGRVDIRSTSYYTFLNRQGFWGYIYDKSRKLVHLKDNIVTIVEKEDIIDFTMDYIRKLPYDLGNACTRYDLLEKFHNKLSHLTSENQLNTFLKLKEPFLKDGRDHFYVYYTNGVLKVTKDNTVLLNYKDVDGLIWKTSIIQREYKPTNEQIQNYLDESDFVKFIKGVTGEKSDKKFSRYISMETIIGYLLHEYKDPSKSIAIILCDEEVSDNPNGGTGKGIVLKALQHFKKATVLDGKNFSFAKSFIFQQVDIDTKLLIFEDIKASFGFERLFSVITEGITVEKKNKQAFYISYEDAPKILITTNYMILGEGNSHNRRKVEIEFSQYYNESHTPMDEFGRMLFEDWDTEQWQLFDLFMINCIQKYLQKGLIKPIIKNIPLRKLRQSTSEEFAMFSQKQLSLLEDDKEYQKKWLIGRFIHYYPQIRSDKSFTQNMFNKWLRIYANIMGFKISERVSNNLALVAFTKKEELSEIAV